MGPPIYTEDKLEYTFFPISTFRKSFRIKADHDAHICLTSEGTGTSLPIIEIFLGGWDNQKSAIRFNKEKPDKAEASTPDLLNKEEWRDFIVEWNSTNTNVKVYLDKSTEPFLNWINPEPFPIKYFGIATHWGGSGEWIIEGKADNVIHTNNSMESQEYLFCPISGEGRLDFAVKAKSNGHIALVAEPSSDSLPMHEIFLGGWDNSKSAIRENREKPDKVVVDTPDLLHPEEFRHFWIQWTATTIKVGQKGSEVPLMNLEPRTFHPVTHFGIRTAHGSDGHWILEEESSESSPEASDGGVDNNTVTTGSIVFDPNDVGSPTPPAAVADPDMDNRTKRNVAVHWEKASDGRVPEGALLAGNDNGQDLYVARASHEGDLLPGKLLPSHSVTYVPWNGREHAKKEYEVLVIPQDAVKWVQVNIGDPIPEHAIPGGVTAQNEVLYIGRRDHEGTLTNGKVHPSHGTLYIPYGGMEVGHPDFEILVEN